MYDQYQWLYQELILKLSQCMSSSDIVKYLNLMILKKYPSIATYLQVKAGMDPVKHLHECDSRRIDQLCSLLENDQAINLEILLTEQLNMFYTLQPEVSTVQNIGGNNLSIQVIEEIKATPQTNEEMDFHLI